MPLEKKVQCYADALLTCQVKHIVHLGALGIRENQAKVSGTEGRAGSGVANCRLRNEVK
jgi:hypothetical protein